jgi:uncharacterized membrane protein YozB (DUF420 family)
MLQMLVKTVEAKGTSFVVSSLNLAAQAAFVIVLAKGIGYVSKIKLIKHGRWMVYLTALVLISNGLVMIPRLATYLQLFALVLGGDYSSAYLSWVVIHGLLGLTTITGAIYVSLDWARKHFGEDEHEGSLRMWGTTAAWIFAFLSGIWVYLLLYSFV